MEIEIKGDVQRLHLEPDDIVVVTNHSKGYSYTEFQAIAREIADKLHRSGITNQMIFLDDMNEIYIISPEKLGEK